MELDKPILKQGFGVVFSTLAVLVVITGIENV